MLSTCPGFCIPKHISNKSKRGAKSKRPARSGSTTVARAQSLVLYNRGQIMPNRFRTWLTTTLTFQIPAGSVLSSDGNYMTVALDNYQPFNTSNTFASVVTGGMQGVAVNGGGLTMVPIGFNFAAANYLGYKVIRGAVTARVMSLNNVDCMRVILFPLGSQSSPGGISGSSFELNMFESQPGARVTDAAIGINPKTLVYSNTIAKIIGRRESAYLDEPPLALNSSTALSNRANIGLFIQLLAGTSNTAAVPVTIEVRQLYEFTNFILPYN